MTATDRTCGDCGTSIATRHHLSRFCNECSDKRNRRSVRQSARRKVAVLRGDPPVYLCVDCGAPRPSRYVHRCDACRQERFRIRDLSGFGRGKEAAHAAVSEAKRHGLLPELDGAIACVDCSRPAEQYDHRDYNFPLLVAPVCRSCNLKRGAAKPAAA